MSVHVIQLHVNILNICRHDIAEKLLTWCKAKSLAHS